MVGKGPFYKMGLVPLLVNFAHYHVGTASPTQYTCVPLLIVRCKKTTAGVPSYITLMFIKVFV